MKVTVKFRYRDGRAARTEVVQVHGEPSVSLNQGALLQLLEWLHDELGPNFLGPQNTGIMLGGKDQLLGYNTPQGIATVALAGDNEAAEGRALRDPRAILASDSEASLAAQRILQRLVKDLDRH